MKVSLLIAAYNRPDYLRQCLASVKAADLSQVSCVLIVDDCSTDKETIQLINEFELEGVELIKAFSKENRSIKGSLLFGLDILFSTCNVVINLDGDAIVTKDAFNRLIKLHKKYPLHIATGFNCSTKNKNGTERHIIIEQGDGVNFKRSVGGINMIFGSNTYLQIVKPALLKSKKENLNWDHQACIASYSGYDRPIACLQPSCVQHIGVDSSMGHSAGGEPPDVAADFGYIIKNRTDGETIMGVSGDNWGKLPPSLKKLQLKNVTLICADGFDVERCIHAANISCRDIEFGAVKILSHLPSDDSRVIKIRPLADKKDYSQFILKEIVDYVDTDFTLIFQYDGFILNASAWDEEFLNWDMVGASWKFKKEKRTANGGFSLRSKKMMKTIQEDGAIYLLNDEIIKNFAEDHVLFHIYREYLEGTHNVKIAPEDVCDKFSIEAWGVKENRYAGSFGFHGFGVQFEETDLPYIPYKLPNRQIL